MRCAERTLDVLSIRPFLGKSDQNCLGKKKKEEKIHPNPLQGSHLWGEILSRFLLR